MEVVPFTVAMWGEGRKCSSGRSQGRDLPSTVEAPGGWAGSGEGQGCRPPPWGPVSFWKGREPDPVRALGKEGQPSRQVLGPQWAGAAGWPRERGSGGCSLGPRGSWEAGAVSTGPGLAPAPRLLHRKHGPAPLRDVHQVRGGRVPDPPGQRPGVSTPHAPTPRDLRGHVQAPDPPGSLAFALFSFSPLLVLCCCDGFSLVWRAGLLTVVPSLMGSRAPRSVVVAPGLRGPGLAQ